MQEETIKRKFDGVFFCHVIVGQESGDVVLNSLHEFSLSLAGRPILIASTSLRRSASLLTDIACNK